MIILQERNHRIKLNVTLWSYAEETLAQVLQGPVSKSDKTFYCKISQSFGAARFVFRIVRSLWNLTGTSAAPLPTSLSNKAMRWIKLPISRLRDLTRSYDKTSYRILKRAPGRHDYFTSIFIVEKQKTTRAVRDCLIRPYARISECFVSYLCLDYACEVGHSDTIPMKWEPNISRNLLSIHTNSQVGISKCIWTTRWKSIAVKRLNL